VGNSAYSKLGGERNSRKCGKKQPPKQWTQTNPVNWTCVCKSFLVSRFPLCKHIVYVMPMASMRMSGALALFLIPSCTYRLSSGASARIIYCPHVHIYCHTVGRPLLGAQRSVLFYYAALRVVYSFLVHAFYPLRLTVYCFEPPTPEFFNTVQRQTTCPFWKNE
jgi:hypothetical protein